MFSFLSKVDREKVFANVLDRKVAFQDYYKKKAKFAFFQRSKSIVFKNLTFIHLLFLCKIHQKKVFLLHPVSPCNPL